MCCILACRRRERGSAPISLSSHDPPRRWRIALPLTAAGLAAALALPSAAQDSPAVPDLDPADCSNGTFVSEPSANPGLVADCQALTAVRNHWTAPGNARLPAGHSLLTWGKDGVSITSWTRVTLSDQRVTELYLDGDRSQGLQGPIPPEIGQLTNLTYLDLHGNQLTGSIPPEIGQLTNLEHLSLYGNQLTGSIPPEISQLTNLEHLSLYGNQLTELPPEIGQLTNLQSLYLDGNQLTGSIPPEISQLTNLEHLSLYGNQLTGSIPPEISQLTNLEHLSLYGNQLTELPPEIGQLTNLTQLNLSENELTGPIPPEISQLTNLQRLLLFGNDFTGTIPPQILEQLGNPFDVDLGLVANVKETRKISLGNNLWEVWICNTNGPLDLDLNKVTGLLNQTVTPYFKWLSEGRFTPQFSATGTITISRSELAQPELEDWTKRLVACENKMLNSDTHNNFNKAVIVENRPHASGVASNNIIVGGGAVTAIGNDSDYTPRFSTVAHEIGHKLGWPHSYNSHIFYDGVLLEGDNSTDIMSGGSNIDLSTGTPAINRYTAGWINPEDVAVYTGKAATYELSPIGTNGTQMLIVLSGKGQGTFYSLSPLTTQEYNRGQPTEGVEVYLIDQSLSACPNILTTNRPCYRIQPHPPKVIETGNSAHHVRETGDIFQLGETRVQIQERNGNRFTITVGTGCGGYYQGRFCDDENNVHTDSIEAIAEWGITQGCRTNEFCPDTEITRRQIAAFLHRAVTHRTGEPPAAAETTLNDVENSAWYRPYAVWAVNAGIMSAPDGMFNPDGIVTRADMAEMLTAAFSRLTLPARAQGIFTDMENQPDRTVRAAETLRTAGITQGCSTSPLRYCPDQPVTRAQMASFFHRALT